MYTTSDLTQLIDDLAAHWTDHALEILKAAGFEVVSIDMEMAAWELLKDALHAELRWQQSFRMSTLMSVSSLMEQVLRKTAHAIAEEFEPQSISYEFENRINQLVSEQRSTAMERALYSAIVRRPDVRNAFKEPSRTDFVPRLRVAASVG
jgi:hypothetical protein